MNTVATVLVNVQALDRLIEKFTLDNLAGCNDNPIMIELVNCLHECLHDGGHPELAHEIKDCDLDDQQWLQISLTTAMDGCQPMEIITSLDLFGMGALSCFTNSIYCEIMDDLYCKHITAQCEEGHRAVCEHVMRHTITSGIIGGSYATMMDDLSHTAYAVPPSSSNDTIERAYIDMASDALFAFDALVMQHVYFIKSVAEYQSEDDII